MGTRLWQDGADQQVFHGHLPAGCVLLSPCSFRSLCFPESVSARMGSGPSQSVIWHVYCEYIIILYNLQGTIMSAK